MEKFIKSFYYAFEGILYVFKHERNARVHLLFAIMAFLLGLALRITNVELAAIFFAVIIVFFAEIVNTTIEKVLDLIHSDHHPQVKIIKDMAAGAVLIAAAAAATVGVVIFTPYLVKLWLG